MSQLYEETLKKAHADSVDKDGATGLSSALLSIERLTEMEEAEKRNRDRKIKKMDAKIRDIQAAKLKAEKQQMVRQTMLRQFFMSVKYFMAKEKLAGFSVAQDSARFLKFWETQTGIAVPDEDDDFMFHYPIDVVTEFNIGDFFDDWPEVIDLEKEESVETSKVCSLATNIEDEHPPKRKKHKHQEAIHANEKTLRKIKKEKLSPLKTGAVKKSKKTKTRQPTQVQ